MISWKLIYAAVSAVVYIILISIFFNIKVDNDNRCSYRHPCVRFCQSDRNIISDQELRKKFKASEVFKYNYHYDDDKNFTMYREELKCENPLSHDADNIRPYGARDDEYTVKYTIDEYCLSETSPSFDGWELLACKRNLSKQRAFHTFAIIITILLMLFTIGVYAYYSELRDINGKFVIVLLTSLTLMQALAPTMRFPPNDSRYFRRYYVYIMPSLIGTCLIFSLKWFTMICYHTYWKLNNFKDNVSDEGRFILYTKIVAIAVLYSVCVFIADFFLWYGGSYLSLLVMYIFMIAFDLYFLIKSSYLLVQIAKSLELSQQRQFIYEKKWFRMYSSFLGIMIGSWLVEAYCWNEAINTTLSLSIIADLTKIYTAINTLIIFVMRKSVQELLFNKYRSLRGNLSTSESEVNKV